MEREEMIPITNLLITITGDLKPELILRKKIVNPELIQIFCSCAYRNTPVIIQPAFSDKQRSIAQMLEKGIIEYDKENDVYRFLI